MQPRVKTKVSRCEDKYAMQSRTTLRNVQTEKYE